MSGIIYKAICLINNKVYIGKTTRSLEKRMREHLRDVDRYKNNKLYNAIKKHGWDNFLWTVEISDTHYDKLNSLEIKTIKKYNSYRVGYNSTIGGDDSPMHDPEVAKKVSVALSGCNNPMYGKTHSDCAKEKISIANNGKKVSEETKAKMSAANKGKKLSDETKAKLSLSRIGKKLSNETKRKISKNNGKSMLGKYHSKESKAKMSRSHTGKKISKESIERFINAIKSIEKNRFFVYKDASLIGEWRSQRECAEELGLIPQSINMCLMGRRKTHKGYTFKRCSDG